MKEKWGDNERIRCLNINASYAFAFFAFSKVFVVPVCLLRFHLHPYLEDYCNPLAWTFAWHVSFPRKSKKKSVLKELLEQLCFDLLYLLTKEGWKLAPDLHFDFLAFSPWPEILSFWNGSWSNPSSIHHLSPNAVWVFEIFSFLRECRATICKLIWFCDQSIVSFGSF